MIDSRETNDRKKAEAAINHLAAGEDSTVMYRLIRKEVLSELRLALNSLTEEERNDHLNLGTENLIKILTE